MPVILLSCSRNETGSSQSVSLSYANALLKVGCTPVAPCYTDSEEAADRYLALADGLLLTGGCDVNPALYGEKTAYFCGDISNDRDNFEMLLARCALRRHLPILGICRGIQMLNVIQGGSLYQDVAVQYSTSLWHRRLDLPNDPVHGMSLVPGSVLSHAYGDRDEIQVNSRHHQGIKFLGQNLKASAIAPDGLIEGIESVDGYPMLGVQWHPESMQEKYPEQIAVFKWLLSAASR